MGTYSKSSSNAVDQADVRTDGRPFQTESSRVGETDLRDDTGIVIGRELVAQRTVRWNPFPNTGAPNPHVLIIGESGYGKSYAIAALITELAQQGIRSIIFDYAQGFSSHNAPPNFYQFARPVEIDAAQCGIDINPLQPFPFDIHGPVSVAQRVADTFRRIYPQLGVQQHALLRQTVLDVLTDGPVESSQAERWHFTPPPFSRLYDALLARSQDYENPSRRLAATLAAHVSTLFVFNTFRSDGLQLQWDRLLSGDRNVLILNLRGLEMSLEKAVTEFLLWNFIGYIEALGAGPLRCFVVLDEAHKLAFDSGSPTDKLLREGRKFGLGVILASQQPEDFSAVAFANTATKLVFQILDQAGQVCRMLHRKVRNGGSLNDLHNTLTTLPRGVAYVVTNNTGAITQVDTFNERLPRWQ